MICLCHITIPLLIGGCKKCRLEMLQEAIYREIVLPAVIKELSDVPPIWATYGTH